MAARHVLFQNDSGARQPFSTIPSLNYRAFADETMIVLPLLMKTIRLLPLVLGLGFSSDLEAQSNPRVANWLKNQDTNGDGRISQRESSGLMKRFFQRNDLNQNGFLDLTELRQMASRLAANPSRDRNHHRKTYPSDEAIRSRTPDEVEVKLNLAYRQGNDAWRLDLAQPRAPSPTPRPAIVFVHGGGWQNGDKRAPNFIGPALEYATRGYVTLSVNYRLDRLILPCVEDVKCAVRWLRAHAEDYHVDPHRIGSYGNSAGAHLVAMLALSHQEPRLEGDGPWKEFSSAVQAVVASATPSLPHFGTGSEAIKTLVAPITHVAGKAPPMLLFHDVSDPVVPVENADQLVAALKAAGTTDITYKRYTNDSGHAVFQRNAEETHPLMEAFFARTLQNPSPGKGQNRSKSSASTQATPPR